MIPACKAAIDAMNDGQYLQAIDLPPGCMYKDRTYAPANAIVEQHHLDAFLSGPEE
jgi:hypothetical protein